MPTFWNIGLCDFESQIDYKQEGAKGWMGGRRESLHGTVWILTQKKILRKKKGGVWCSLHRCTRKLIDSQWKGMRVERRNRSKDFSLTRGIIFLMVKFHFHHISHPNQEPVQWCHRTWGKSSGFHYFMLVFFVACGMMSLVQGMWTLLSKFGFPFPPPPTSSYSSIIHLSLPTKDTLQKQWSWCHSWA